MKELDIFVNKLDIFPARLHITTIGSYGEKIRVVFSKEWDGLTKTMHIFPKRGTQIDIVLVSDYISLPPMFETSVEYVISGAKDGSALYSVRGIFEFESTRIPGEGTPPEERQTFIEQSEELIGDASAAASEARQAGADIRAAAERGDFDGEKGDKGDKGDPGSADVDEITFLEIDQIINF